MNDTITAKVAAHIKVLERSGLGASQQAILLRKVLDRLSRDKPLSAAQRAGMYAALNIRVSTVDRPLLVRLETLINTGCVSGGVRRILEDFHEQVVARRPLTAGQYDVITRTEARLSSTRADITETVARHMRWAERLSRQTGAVKPYSQRTQDRLTRTIEEYLQSPPVLYHDDYVFVRGYFRDKFKEAEEFKFKPGTPVRIREPSYSWPPTPPSVGVVVSTPDVITSHTDKFRVGVLSADGLMCQVAIDLIMPLKESTKKH